jgi:asparagine synthase (glutamine-hydrolysing)
MCGIAGIVRFNDQISLGESQKVEAAIQLLSKRGPDHQSIKTDGKICFGHARLSIIETSALSHQPMYDSEGRYLITYNGELYNYRDIRKNLESKGITFKTQSDTEVLLNAYKVYGTNCLEHFNGFFAFGIYDRQTDTFFGARDRMGIKPFYYSIGDDSLNFASELKALKPICNHWKLNNEALSLYFEMTYVPAPLSMIAGINKLFPGESIELKNGQVQLHRYFKTGSQKKSADDFEAASVKVKNHLQRSVNLRMVADVPLGTFLSGGIDSSIISMLAAQKKVGLETFSLGFKDLPWFDESKYAQVVAHHIGSKHHEIMVTEKDLCAHIHDMLEVLDEPFADSSALAVYALSKETSKHVKVALSGDGADELFGGYNKHRALLRSESAPLANELLKAARPIFSLFAGSRDGKWSNQFRKINKYVAAINLPLPERYWKLASWSDATTVQKLLLNFGESQFKTEFVHSLRGADMNQLLEADLNLVLPNDMLTKVDRMSMAHGLEVRTPFLDHELVQYVNSLPFHYKTNLNFGKLLLRNAFKNDLPKIIFTRTKQGFEIPLEQWLKNELSPLLKSGMNAQLIEEQGIFNLAMLQQLVSRLHSNNVGDSAATLWSFIVFQTWWKQHFEPKQTIEG